MRSKLSNEPESTQFDRIDVPDSAALQQRIIKRSAEIKQENVGFKAGGTIFAADTWAGLRNRFALMPSAAIVTGLVVAVLSLAILLPVNQQAKPEFANNGRDQTSLSQAQLLEDELAWQELLLMQDELAFMTVAEL